MMLALASIVVPLFLQFCAADPHIRHERQTRVCSWGNPAVSACFPATGTTPARCGRPNYTCDTARNFCCLSPGTGPNPPRPMPPCPDGTPAVAACFYKYCGAGVGLICTPTNLCCPNTPANGGGSSPPPTPPQSSPPSSPPTSPNSSPPTTAPTTAASTAPSTAPTTTAEAPPPPPPADGVRHPATKKPAHPPAHPTTKAAVKVTTKHPVKATTKAPIRG